MYSNLFYQRDEVAEQLRQFGNGELGIVYAVTTPVYRTAHRTETTVKPNEASIIVMGLGYSEQALTRASKAVDISIQVVVESRYVDDRHVGTLVTLTEQIMSVCSSLNNWTENRASIDEHGMPFQFHNLREQSIYQGIFDAVYRVQRVRKLVIP